MKSDTPRIVDGNRHRCQGCGHPRKEHRASVCSVPKCPCMEYGARGVRAQAG
jgi:hypothetical protein